MSTYTWEARPVTYGSQVMATSSGTTPKTVYPRGPGSGRVPSHINWTCCHLKKERLIVRILFLRYPWLPSQKHFDDNRRTV
jgi:hypothetical protein